MKIRIDKNTIELLPENESETIGMTNMWNILVDCQKFNRKIVPIGEYVPSKENLARFLVEGEVDSMTPVISQADYRVYCQTCNKYFDVKKGDQIPLCCGQTMEVLD
jgi:hypothetical protein